MALTTESYVASGSQREFQIATTVLSESHVRVHIDYNDGNGDIAIPSNQWDLLSSTVLFNTAPTSGSIVKLTISTDGEGLDDAPTDISNVAANIDKVITVGNSINAVNTLATEPTLTAMLNAETNANTATAQATIATTQAGIATTQATEASTYATNAATSASNAATSEANALTYSNNASTSATNASTSATNASDSLASFQGQYTSSTTEPASPVLGTLWFDETAGIMKVYDGNGFVSAGSSVNGTSERFTYTATSGQTTFSATYDAGYVDVYVNGLKLQNTVDFTATNGSSVVMTSGLNDGDIVDIIAYGTFSVADTYTQATIDTLLAAKADTTYVDSQDATKQDVLVSGTNIKTVNSNSLLGSGNIEITGGATGGGNDKIFIENGQTVTTDYTIPSGSNAMSTGDLTINTGVTVTVSTGSRWVVL